MIEPITTHGEKLRGSGQKTSKFVSPFHSEIKQEIAKSVLQYVLAAFGLVAGLAWNEAINSLIEYLFPLAKNTLLAKFFYAIIMTLVLVVISLYLVKLLRQDGEEN